MADSGAIKAGNAFILLSVKNTIERNLKEAKSKLESFTSEASGILQTSLAANAPVILGVKNFAAFDDQMRLVQGVTGSTGAEFEKLTAKAEELGRTTSWSAAEVASGMVSLGRAGFKSNEIDAAIGSVMDLARATGTDIDMATDIAGSALRAFNMDASQMSDVCDVLTATANGSAQTLEDLGYAFKYIAPVAAATGETLKDTAYSVGTLANFGVKGSSAGTVLRNMQTRMVGNETAIKEYTRLGIDTKDAQGNLRKVSDILKDIEKKTGSMGSGDRLESIKKLFGEEGLTGITITTANFGDLENAIKNAEGTASSTAQKMDSGLGGSFRIMQSSVEGLGNAISRVLEPSIKSAAQILTSFSGWLTRISAKYPETVKTIALIAASVTGMSSAFWVIGRGISSFLSSIQMIGTAFKAVYNCGEAVARFLKIIPPAEAAAGAAAQNARKISVLRAASMVGVSAAIAGAVVALNHYFGAEERAAEAAARATQTANDQARQHEEQRGKDKELFARLEELANKSELTNQEFAEGVEIARQLKNAYGDLGVQIDENTKSFGGLTEAASEFQKAQLEQEIRDKEFILSQEKQEQNALQKELDKMLNGSTVRAYWDAARGVVTGNTIEKRADAINKRKDEITHNRQKLENELSLLRIKANPERYDNKKTETSAATKTHQQPAQFPTSATPSAQAQAASVDASAISSEITQAFQNWQNQQVQELGSLQLDAGQLLPSLLSLSGTFAQCNADVVDAIRSQEGLAREQINLLKGIFNAQSQEDGDLF